MNDQRFKVLSTFEPRRRYIKNPVAFKPSIYIGVINRVVVLLNQPKIYV